MHDQSSSGVSSMPAETGHGATQFFTPAGAGAGDGAQYQHQQQQRQPPRVHILGMGNIGCFIAHSLRGLPDPPAITLLLHNEQLYDGWWKLKRRTTLIKHGLVEHARGFDVSVLRGCEGDADASAWFSPPAPPAIAYRSSIECDEEEIDEEGDAGQGEEGGHRTADQDAEAARLWYPDDDPIDHLVLACKATQVNRALRSVAHRLHPASTIVFLQNGMGVTDEVDRTVFPDAAARPSYVTGIVTHGLYRVEPFKAVHTGMGTTALALTHANPRAVRAAAQSRDGSDDAHAMPPTASTESTSVADATLPQTSRYLLHLLASTPALTATAFDATTVTALQLEKLAMNCAINPLTALFGCKNGALLQNFNASRMQRLLLIEFAAVVRAMPEMQGIAGLAARFSPERLRKLVVGLEQATADNKSSMLQDALGGRETEIKYLNGYIVRRGDELGIRCVANYMLMQAVLAKTRLANKAEEEVIPFEHMGELL
ncbi:hypothetical protein KEM52_001638 [Ascosphaera acerosa]|nr:hypothetical protein KEM52_001638 [Ascosphaera acerosa]